MIVGMGGRNTERLRGPKNRLPARRGVASIDYVLILGIVLPLILFIFRVAPRMMQLAYEMVCALIDWPFM